MSDKKGPGRVGDIIPAVLRLMGLEDRIDEGRLVKEWRGIVGDLVASKSSPLEIRDETLVIEVGDNAWMQEIRFHQKRIIEKINERFPELGIKEIRLRMERVKDGE
jgi:predicted nucleic acid-binding Zn ribbon protein